MSIVRDPNPDVVVTHPNRDTAAAKGTRLFVIALLVASAVLIILITLGSSGSQAGALGLQVVLGILFAYYAYLVFNWRSGILPLAAGTAIVAGIFAAVTVPGWFDRGGSGYTQPPLPESLVGVLIFAFAVVQLVTVIVCLKAFTQQWQVELEVPRSSLPHAA